MNFTKDDLLSALYRLKDNTTQIKEANELQKEANELQKEANFLKRTELCLQLGMMTKEEARETLRNYYGDSSQKRRR